MSPELDERQQHLVSLVAGFDELAFDAGLLEEVPPASPIRFIEIGDEHDALEVGAALKAAGYFVNVAVFPAVPRRRAGLRILLNFHHTMADVHDLIREITRVAPGGKPRRDSMAALASADPIPDLASEG